MKKPFRFDVRRDDYLCCDCHRPLKANVIARKLKPPPRCYKCGKEFKVALQIMKGKIR